MPAFLRKYGTGSGADIYLPLIKRGAVDFALAADWTPAAGDVKVSKDGAAAANIGTLPTAVPMGNTTMWKFVFSDAELQAKTIAVTVADAATKTVEDQMLLIETYGHASAMYPPDFSDAAALGLARLDATVGSRLAALSYTAPDNAGIASAASAAASAASSAASADGKATVIQAKTDNLPADPASATQVATRSAAGDAMTLTAGERSTLVSAMFDFVVEGTEKFVELLRLVRATLLGKSDGFPSGPVHFRDHADTKNRVTATVDSEGNRTAVSTDPS